MVPELHAVYNALNTIQYVVSFQQKLFEDGKEAYNDENSSKNYENHWNDYADVNKLQSS